MGGSQGIDRWLADYEVAWTTGTGVTDLFTADAHYFTAPYQPPLVGADAIESWWIAQGESGTRWTFEREVIAADGSLFVVKGTTTYHDIRDSNGQAQVYYNLWLITLADNGKASKFVEYWMLPE